MRECTTYDISYFNILLHTISLNFQDLSSEHFICNLFHPCRTYQHDEHHITEDCCSKAITQSLVDLLAIFELLLGKSPTIASLLEESIGKAEAKNNIWNVSMLRSLAHTIHPKHRVLILAILWTILASSLIEEALAEQNRRMRMRISTSKELIALLRTFRIDNHLTTALAILVNLLNSPSHYIYLRMSQ